MNPTLSQKHCSILACTGYHILHTLAGALVQTAVTELVSEFVDNHLLHWFECLSALGELGSGIKSLDIAYKAISVSIQFGSG